MPQSSPPRDLNKRNVALDCALLLTIAIVAVLEFSSFFSSVSFGSEFTQFYLFVHDRSLGEILRYYLQLHVAWYRPSQFFLPYWIGDHLVSWHNPAGWRVLEMFTMLIVCALIYWFVLVLLPGRRIAAFAAALYFTCVPVVYLAVYQIAAFDFIHIIFGLFSAIAFLIGYRSRTRRAVGWTVLAWFSYVMALTSKEITIVIPVYLTVLSAILYFYEPGPGERRGRILREVKRLVPFWMMTVVYWVAHVRRMPVDPFGGSADYRLQANWEIMLENANKFPLWLARIYGHTLDTHNQAAGYINRRNDLVGGVALLLVIYACFRLWRSGAEYRKYLLLTAAWMAVFLIVPIYSGGYFWHGNLALCGYSMLFGAAADWWVTRIPQQAARYALLAFLVAGGIGLTRIDAAQCLIAGIQSEPFRINSTILSQPPVPLNRIAGPALVYVEDRNKLGTWSFGAGSLFNLVYLDRELRQVVVPAMDKVGFEERARWLKHPNAFFFRYDDRYHWWDATEQFRALALAKADQRPALLKITSLGPAETRAGVGFNVQPGGLSALSVTGLGFESGSEILINGQRSPTTFGSTEWLTTIVPHQAYSRAGSVLVQVKNPDGLTSNTSTFRVLP